MKNYYPEKPIIQYRKTSVEMAFVIADIKAMHVDKEVKRMAYIMFRNESGNGRSGICNNYCGFQADSGRWSAIHDDKIDGVVIKRENGTGLTRYFLSFRDVTGCLDMLIERVIGRGLYIGGTTKKIWKNHRITSPEDLCLAYQKEWVKGDLNATPTDTELRNFKSMYSQAEKLFIN